MPYFSSIQHFIDTITARFNKPKRSLLNDGIVKQDIIEALTDCAKYGDDVKSSTAALNSNFITRSLNITATCYIRADGDDSRTGERIDFSATGAVKTFQRIAELHNNKTTILNIIITGIFELTADAYLSAPFVNIFLTDGTRLHFRKNLADTTKNYAITVNTTQLSVLDLGGYSELKSDNVDLSADLTKKGCFRIVRDESNTLGTVRQQSVLMRRIVRYIGDNSILFVPGASGASQTRDGELVSFSVIGGSLVSPGVNAKDHAFLNGLGLKPRTVEAGFNPGFTDELWRNGNELYFWNGTVYIGREKEIIYPAGSTRIIRRPYRFLFTRTWTQGTATVSTQPPATCEANTDYSLVSTGSGDILITITPII